MHNSGSVGDSSIQRPGTLRSLATIPRTTYSIVQIAQQQLHLLLWMIPTLHTGIFGKTHVGFSINSTSTII
jgi:hypothetical protein